MADLYYNPARGLNDNDRSKIQFVLVNDDGAARDFDRLKLSGQYQGKYLPAYNDDSKSNLMNNISGGKEFPKDDMAILDKEGRMIQYFDSSQSSMGNRSNNKIKAAVEKVLSDDYKNPCEGDSASSESDESKEDDKSPLDVLKATCMLKDNCSNCKGKVKKGACKLKKKLKCKFMGTEDLCKKAQCKYKPAKKGKKAKCTGKGIF